MSTTAEVAGVIEAAPRLALACHIGPDGDALGSMLALGIAANRAGKEVAASFGSPFSVPGNLSFLPADLLVAPNEFPEAPEVMVVFDAGSADRLGDLAPTADKAGVVVVIDHHMTNEGFGDVTLIDASAAATGVLVAQVLDELGWEIGPDVATCLHTALVTDTGRFQYANTTPETLQLAARLVAAGAQPAEISRYVYEEAPFGYLKAAAIALSRVQLDADLGLVWTFVTDEDLEQSGVEWGDVDNLMNTVRLAEEADTAVILKVHHDGRVKASLRSRGATDVGSLAADLGGGGHRLAAGFTYQGDVETALKEIVGRIGKYR